MQKTLCDCFAPQQSNKKWQELVVHPDNQDRTSKAWQTLLKLIDKAAEDKREIFAPRHEMTRELWQEITVLPTTIGKLVNVKKLDLYGSQIAIIPREIGQMTALEVFEPYCSYNLHWFPYEITRCKNLKDSFVSTRALYGNYVYRPPFPRLRGNPVRLHIPAKCSICDKEPGEQPFNQVWLSLQVATDVLPLLVHICSQQCHEKVPPGAEGYITRTHKGSLGLSQPPKRWC